MQPPENDLVVADCDEALRLDPRYVKALNRRATALEALGRFEESLRGMVSCLYADSMVLIFRFITDFTASTILEKFSNEQTAASVERVLKKLASKKAEEILAVRETSETNPT